MRVSSLLQILDALPSRGARWLRGHGAAVLSSYPTGASPRKVVLPPRVPAGAPRVPLGPGPTLPPPLPGPSHAHAGRGSPGTSWRGLCGRAAAASPPSRSSLSPPRGSGRNGKPCLVPPSCPTRGAAGPLSSSGKSSQLRVGHQGLPWVVACLKGEA